jgi:hypothetical protein
VTEIKHARLTYVHAEEDHHESLQARSVLGEVREIEDGLEIQWAFGLVASV